MMLPICLHWRDAIADLATAAGRASGMSRLQRGALRTTYRTFTIISPYDHLMCAMLIHKIDTSSHPENSGYYQHTQFDSIELYSFCIKFHTNTVTKLMVYVIQFNNEYKEMLIISLRLNFYNKVNIGLSVSPFQ